MVNNRKILFGFLIILAFVIANPVVSFSQENEKPEQIAVNTIDENESKVDLDGKTSEEKSLDTNVSPAPKYPALNYERVGVNPTQTNSISLDDAIRLALTNNNDIEIARDDVKIAESNLRSLLGTYDGVFSVSPNIDFNRTTGRPSTKDIRVNSSFTKLIRPGGGNYSFFYNNIRTENAFAQAQASQGNLTTGSSSALFSTRVGFTYTQPLLRDFKIDQTRRQIKIQRKRIAQSDAEFRRRTIEIISQVQRAYWDLVFALRDQQNRIANLNLSKENLRQIEAKIEAGSSAPLARAEVATELANRESDVLLATQQVTTAENVLKQLLLKDPTAPEWSSSFVPTDSPVFSLDPVNLDSAMQDAIANRPELSRLRIEDEINAIDIDYFKNQTKPQIDFTSTFSLDGLASSGAGEEITTNFFTSLQDLALLNGLNETRDAVNLPLILNPEVIIPAPPSFLIGGYGQASRNLFRSDAPNYSFGVTFSFPLGNKTAKADLATARIQKNRIDAQKRQQEQVIVTEVRNAVQAVETARQRALAARRARQNAEIQLAGERKLFEVGRSTTFLLFQRENALANARNAEIRAETDYNKALSDLQRATSTTFRANNIVVDTPSDDN